MPTDEIVTEAATKALREIHFGTKSSFTITALAIYGAVSATEDVVRIAKKFRARRQALATVTSEQNTPS